MKKPRFPFFSATLALSAFGFAVSDICAPGASAQTVPAAIPPIANPATSDGFDVRSFGARGDGQTLDSDAINAAILAASKAGGGTVRVPAGTYLCLSIRLQSNIRLHLDAGAVIEAAQRTEARRYDEPEENDFKEYQDFGHSHGRNSLIWGENLQNVTIDGSGEIYGKGLVDGLGDKAPKTSGTANKAIALKSCRNVNIKDITIRHGGWFAILATGVDNFVLDNLKIDTNRDGIDIDCCRNVRVSNCSVNTPIDDGICLKSSYALNEARATENVTISNCFVSGYREGTMLDGTRVYDPKKATGGRPTGRIKFGTESNGGFKNIAISNCVFEKCRGLALETVDGGLLEDVSISNLTMRNIGNSPIFLFLGSRMRGPQGVPVGKLRRINISNIVAYNVDPKSCVLITGVPGHPIEDVSLSNIQIWFAGGGTEAQAAITPPDRANTYPEPASFGAMPAYGFYLRHIKGLTLDNIQLHTLTADARPPIALSDVTGAEFFRIKADRGANIPVFAVENSSDLTIRMVKGALDQEKKELFSGKF